LVIPGEVWSPIPGHDYEASNLGRIRSVDRWRVCERLGYRRWLRSYRGRILKASIDTGGYPTVTLGHHGQYRVHVLVMLAFVGPCPDGLEVCHNDGEHENVALSNLRYDTRKSNIEDARQHGKAWWLNAKNSK
jgi:hypothetical protein